MAKDVVLEMIVELIRQTSKTTFMISVIVPIYNAEIFLSDCLTSILNQTIKDIEVILVDDGSTDGSGDICEKYCRMDDRIHYILQENAGVSVARNTALEVAKGEYVVFIDSDDVVAPDFLQQLLDLSAKGDFAICGYTRNQSELGNAETSRDYYDVNSYIIQIFDESLIHPNIWMMLFKNDIIQSNKLRFTPGCVRNEDTEFYIKYLTFEKAVVVSDYKGYFYRDNPGSAVHKFNEKALTFIEADHRISDYLIGKGIVNSDNLIVAASVEYFVYQTARQKNIEIYDRVHELYDVKSLMKAMTKHPRLARKGVAIVYSILGKKLFYKTLSLV